MHIISALKHLIGAFLWIHCNTYLFFSLQYKYQINIDGTVAAYRLPYLMIGDAVVIKQDSEYYEHFYHQLEPYKHYIPMQHDLNDVVEQVQWAIDNDHTVGMITNAVLKHFLFFRQRRLVKPVRSLLRAICYQSIFIAILYHY